MRLTATGFDVGFGERDSWHRCKIQKAPLGTVGKIREELAEYVDALHQRLFLVQCFELSDLVGALASFLWNHQIPFDLAQPSARAVQHSIVLGSLGFVDAIPELLFLLEKEDPSQHTRIQMLAETFLILVFEESSRIKLPIYQLLAQAQLRSAIAQNSCSPPTGSPSEKP